MPPRKRLGQLLTELKIVDEHQLQSALGHQKQWGGKLGAILVQKGFCREDQVVAALSQHLSMPAVRLADVKIDPRAVKMVSRAVAERLHVFAYEVTGSGRSEVITIAMSDPTDLSAVDQLAFHTGKRIKPMLAGDTEVVAAIQQHYAPEKPPDAAAGAQPGIAGARPFVDGARAPGGAARPTPNGPMHAVPAGFTPVPAAPRPSQTSIAPVRPLSSTSIPPVRSPSQTSIPPVRPSQTSMSPVRPAPAPLAAPPPAPTPPPEPVEPLALEGGDLPADAPMDGLEPIAAHSQGDMSLDGADGIASPGSDATSSDEPIPLEDPSALQGWAEGSPEGVPLEGPESGAGEAAQAGGPVAMAAAPVGEPTNPSSGVADELPIDAILGTADVLEHTEATPASADAPDAWSDISDPLAAQPESAAAGPTDEAAALSAADSEQPPQEEASSSGGPEWEAAAAAIQAAANESEDRQPGEESASAADAGELPLSVTEDELDRAEEIESADAETSETLEISDAAYSAESAEEEEAARASPEEASFLESPEDPPAPLDEVSIDAGGWDESAASDASADAAEPAFSMSSPAEEPPSGADAEASFDVDTQDGAELDGYAEDHEISATQRHGWLLRHREESADSESAAESPDAADQQESFEEQGSATSESFEGQQGYEHQEGFEQEEGLALEGADSASLEDPGSYDSGDAGQQDSYAADASSEQPAAGEGEESIELASDEGWTGQSEDAPGGAWFGDALTSTTPLSPADVGTLTALGLDPADGAAAQRMLACLVRVLNRRQAIDLDELAAEIRESQVAADASAQPQGEDQPGAGEAETSSPDDPANVQD